MFQKHPKRLFFPADDQGAFGAVTKSCHGDKFRLTTPLTTYGNYAGEGNFFFVFSLSHLEREGRKFKLCRFDVKIKSKSNSKINALCLKNGSKMI